MTTPLVPSHPAVTYAVEVPAHGRIELQLPYASGTRLTIVVIPTRDASDDDLMAAAAANLSFWDNPFDDEDWNAA